jgi:hypothetical protein
LDEFGFGGFGIELDDLTSPDCVVQMGYPRTGSISSRASREWISTPHGNDVSTSIWAGSSSRSSAETI